MSLWSRAVPRMLRNLSFLQLQPSQSAPATPAPTPASQTELYERLLVSERSRLEAERTASDAKLKEEGARKVFEAEKGRLEAESRLEIQALRTEGMSLKGRLHARGLQEEAEDLLRIKYNKWDMSRKQLYTELAGKASEDQLISCMKAGAAAAKQDIGGFATAMYKRLSESVHEINRTSGMMGRPIVILLDGVLTATECDVLVCMAEFLKLPYEYRRLGDNVDLTPRSAKGASSKE